MLHNLDLSFQTRLKVSAYLLLEKRHPSSSRDVYPSRVLSELTKITDLLNFTPWYIFSLSLSPVYYLTFNLFK